MAGTSKGIAVTFAGLAIFAALAGWLYYDYMRIPPDVVAAYEAFVDEGDPLPLAALGDRAQGVVPQLAAIVLDAPGIQTGRVDRDDATMLLGVIGGPKAVDALIKRLYNIEADRPPDKWRAGRTMAPMYALAMLDSPRGTVRLLTFPIERNIEVMNFQTLDGAYDPVPDDPALLLQALQESPEGADYCALVNLPHLCREYLSFDRVLASEELTEFLINNYRRYSVPAEPWYGANDTYLTLLRAMRTPRAEAFVSNLPPEESHTFGWGRTPRRHESARDILDRYLAIAERSDRHPAPTAIFESDMSDEEKLVELLNTKPSESTWGFMSARDNRNLMRLGGAIAPFLIGCMEQDVRSDDSWLTVSQISRGRLECLYLLRRATGRNFGLNPEAWRRWWEREGRAEFEGVR